MASPDAPDAAPDAGTDSGDALADLPLRRLQTAALAAAGVFLVVGFLASLDLRLLPVGPPWLAWLAHPLLAVCGAAGGLATALRGREVDRWRWAMVEDPMLTSGEREEAHREAERQRRHAGTVFLAAPVFLGYWLVYQLAGGLATWLLPASALAGFAIGLLVAGRLVPDERPT
jgi:hypothetical protein